MRIALAHLNFTVGDIEGNTQKIAGVPADVDGSADLVVVSEMAVSGYPPGDLLKSGSFIRRLKNSLRPHDLLDRILDKIITQRKIPKVTEFAPCLVKEICRRVDRNEHKRRQFAPVMKVTSRAFDVGRRMPLAAKY